MRIGPFVNAEQRLPVAAGEQPGHRLVRDDHQLLDERVCVRLSLPSGSCDAALTVEVECDLGPLDPQRPAREPPSAQLGRVRGRELELLRNLGRNVAALRLAVGQPGVAADRRAVEERLAARGELDGHARPVDVRPQGARVVRELGREHRRDQTGHVGRERPGGRPSIERRACRDERRDVGDVHPGTDAVPLAHHRDRVVEVLRRVGVDRERRQVAEIDSTFAGRLPQVDGLQRRPRAALDQETLEHSLDPARRPEHALDLRSPPTTRDHGQVASFCPVQRLAIEGDRRPRREVGLAHHELAATRDLHHCPDRLQSSTDSNAQLPGHPIPPPAASVARKASRVCHVSCRNGELDAGPRGR